MPSAVPIHVDVVHADAIVAAGVAAVLAACKDIVATVTGSGDARHAVTGDEDRDCDLVIADYGAALEFASLSRRARAEGMQRPRVLVLTHLDREWDVRVAMESGVHGYLLLQRCGPLQLEDAVHAVHAGARHVSSELALKLADCLMRDELTVREMQVLGAMATGATNRTISLALGIADATVKAHVRSILSKVGAGARTEAVAIAVRRGLTSVRTSRTMAPRVSPGRQHRS